MSAVAVRFSGAVNRVVFVNKQGSCDRLFWISHGCVEASLQTAIQVVTQLTFEVKVTKVAGRPV